MQIKASAPRGKWSLRERVSSMTLKATDDEEAEDMAFLLKCLMRNGGSYAVIQAAKKHLGIEPGELSGGSKT